jgi:hypothetical protein
VYAIHALPNMLRMRGGYGLGDAIYQRPIAEYLVSQGKEITVCTAYPEVFDGAGVTTAPFSRERIQILAHYSARRANPTTQFQDMCECAKVPPLGLRFEWKVKGELCRQVRCQAKGKPVVLVHGGREPFGRTDGLGRELVPTQKAFAVALRGFADCFTVRFGNTAQYELKVDLDLAGKTSVSDLLDLGWACDAVVGQVSFVAPLSECFDKPFLAVWAQKGLDSRHEVIRQITPRKILSKATSHYVLDSFTEQQIAEGASAVRGLV